MRRDKHLSQFFSSSIIKLLATTIFVLDMSLCTTRSVEGAPVYSQITPAEPGSAFSSNNIPLAPKVADNFMLSGPGTVLIRSVRFIGGYGVNSPPPITPPLNALPPDNFRIVFLTDAGGSPGTPIAGAIFDIGSAYSRTPTDGQLLNGVYNPVEYIVNTPNSVTLDSATEYWISITNNTGPDHSWLWARADGVLDQSIATTNDDVSVGPWSVFVSGGMFFEVSDQAIPEPASLRILLMAGTAVMIRRRPRRLRHRSF